jgi:tripartite-type tricarboxylate transporter receptor subunit TctC
MRHRPGTTTLAGETGTHHCQCRPRRRRRHHGPADGARLGERLGHPFIVENRAGGDGSIGFEAVVRAEPDGYTFLFSPRSAVMMAPHVVNRADLDPVKAFIPVAATERVSLYVLVKPDLPIQNYPEFLGYACTNPGKLHYGTPGNATSPHIATEVFSREARVKLNHVPYKGAGPALKDLLGGIIDFAFDPGVGLGQAKAGKLRMVAVAGPVRHPDFPDVPTLEENGVQGVDGGPHFGFYAPLKTSPAIVDRLNREVAAVMKEKVFLDRMKALAVDLAPPMTPAAFATYVRRESARYGKLMKELNITR